MRWLWNRSKKTKETVYTCVMAPGALQAAPGRTPDQVGPEEPLSPKNPVAKLVGLLLQEADKRNADTIELEPDRSKDCIRVRSKGSGEWEQTPLPEYLWSPMVFTCLRNCVIESCEGVIEDPASGEHWRFTFRKQDNQIQFSRLTPQRGLEIQR